MQSENPKPPLDPLDKAESESEGERTALDAPVAGPINLSATPDGTPDGPIESSSSVEKAPGDEPEQVSTIPPSGASVPESPVSDPEVNHAAESTPNPLDVPCSFPDLPPVQHVASPFQRPSDSTASPGTSHVPVTESSKDFSAPLAAQPSSPQPFQNSPSFGASAGAPVTPPIASPSFRTEPVSSPVPAESATPNALAHSRPQTPQPARADQAAQTQTSQKPDEPAQPKGLLDLYDTEELVCEVDSGDDGRFVLTSQRLIYQGRSAEGSLFSAAAVDDVTAIEFGRRPRDSRSAWWGVVGLVASIAVWQVTTNETVGAVAGAVVAGISLLLLADYWFRPAGLVLRFGTPGGTVGGPVSNKRVRDAEELAARVQQMKHSRSGTGRSSGRTDSGRPPGGSPGL